MHDPIHHRFATVADQMRDAVALRTPVGDTTFAALARGSMRLARVLANLCEPEDRIAIVSTNHAVIATSVLGALHAGCVFAPLGVPGEPQLVRALRFLQCKAIITDAAARLPPIEVPVIELADTELVGAPRGERSFGTHAHPDAPCSIYFTSGSTGAPRAILGRLAGIDHHVAWEIGYLGRPACARGTILHAPSYDAYLADLLVPLCAGGRACAPPSPEPTAMSRWLAAEHITLVHCVPSLLRGLFTVVHDARPEAILLAGEVVRASDVVATRAVFGPEVRLVNLYGPSEATFVKLHHEIVDADLARETIPIGVPMPDVTVHVLDDDERPRPDGEVGQLAIQSRYGALGYIDEPALTRARFRPAAGGEQLYLTGDLGRRLPDGPFAFAGRRDRQVKVCGARVDLDEVEAILGGCPGVVEAAVVTDPELTALFGYVVLAANGDLAAVRRAVMGRSTPAMRLARITPLATMPRTTTGKLDRKQLAEIV